MIKLKGKKGKISLLLIFVLLFSLLASSLVMAETQDSELQEGVVGIQAEEFLEEEPEEETVEELEEEAKEEPAKEEPPVGDPNEGIGEEEAPLAVMSAITPLSTTEAQNYFEASGTSTNDHYTVKGVYIDLAGEVHLIIDNDKATANQTRFHSPMLNEEEAAGFELSDGDYASYWDEIGTTLTLTFTDDSTKVITGERLFDFNLGPMVNVLKDVNTLQMLNQADGFSIRGMTFTLDLGHEITKEADKALVTIGDEVIYTIEVKNTGNLPLSGINVYDDVPQGLTITGVSDDSEEGPWGAPDYTEGGNVILDTGLSLAVDGSKTYYLRAEVNEDAKDGDVIVNTAFTGGSVPREEDTAEVEVEIKLDVTVEKFITGNFGDLSREFEFIVTINDDEQVGFSLGDKDLKVFEDLQPGDVITLVEESNGYEVTVEVNGKVVDPVDGVYTITLTDQDTAITVTNHKDVVIDTGISLDSLPYILILGLAGGGLGISIVRKRNSYKRD